MPNEYEKGDLVSVQATFTNAAGGLQDPGAVYLSVRAPNGTVTTYTYGVTAAIVRDSLGTYSSDISATASGTWRYRWYSDGAGQAADEDVFYVLLSSF